MIKGILFDLDGVLLSTDQFHFRAWKALAVRLAIPFDRRQGDRCRGISRMESLDIVLENSTRIYTPEEKLQFAEEKNHAYRALLQGLTPADVPEETVRVLTQLRMRGYQLALASGSKNAELILERTGLRSLLDGVVDGKDITHSKPDPEVFCKAAQALDLSPRDCVGVDDASAGVQSIRAAGALAAAIGPAAQAGEGDWNLKSLSQLLEQCLGMEAVPCR